MSNPIIDLAHKLEAEAEQAWDAIEEVGSEILKEGVALVDAALHDFAGAAIGAVLTEAPKAISGAEKFGNAVADVIQTVEIAGRQIVLQDAHLLVQSAYDTIRAKLVAAQGQ